MERNDLARQLAASLKLARNLARLTQGQVAKATGLAASYISKLEAGEHLPSLPKLLAVCGAIGMDPWLALESIGASRPGLGEAESFEAAQGVSLAEILEEGRTGIGRSIEGMIKAAAARGRRLGIGSCRAALAGEEPKSVDRILALAAGAGLEDWAVLAAAGMPAPKTWGPGSSGPLVATEGVRPLKVVGQASAGESFGAPPYPGDEVVWVPTGSLAAWAFRVDGDSMCGARICHGDIVTVRPLVDSPKDGRVVVAEASGALVVKRFRAKPTPHLEEHFHGREPRALQGSEFRVLGEVVDAVHRVQ